MDPGALALLLGAAVAHAVWNLQAKRAGGGAAFVWLYTVVGLVAWAVPAAVDGIVSHGAGAAAVGFMLGSGVLHTVYFLALQRAYGAGDLSVVYPLARGTGPLGATVLAILVLGERPTALALAGAGLIVVAVLTLVPRSGPGAGRERRAGMAWALLTGVTIALYTVWDKHGVDALDAPPVLYFWVAMAFQSLLLAPVALRARGRLRPLWRAHRSEALSVGLLAPLAYVMVLFALRLAPVSYVAPAREAGIVLGAVFGARLLGEGDARRRIGAAVAIVAGIAALALG
jgi:drug/metabolite transporter (DMT)-like permease